MSDFIGPDTPISQGFVGPDEPIEPIGEQIEPGVMGETAPIEQKLLENAVTALSGATAPSALTGLVGGVAKLAGRGVGSPLEALPTTKNIVPTIQDVADDMLLKSLGTRASQIRQVGGLEAARDAAKVGRMGGGDQIFCNGGGR